MEQSNSNFITIVLSGIAVGLVLAIAWFGYQIWTMSNDVGEVPPAPLTIKEEVEQARGEAVETFWAGYDYEGGIAAQQDVVAMAQEKGLAQEDVGMEELQLSRMIGRGEDDLPEMFARHATIYNNPANSAAVRYTALYDVMDVLDSHLGTRVSLELAASVFAAGQFDDILPPGMVIVTEQDVIEAMRLGMQRVIVASAEIDPADDFHNLRPNALMGLARSTAAEIAGQADVLSPDEYQVFATAEAQQTRGYLEQLRPYISEYFLDPEERFEPSMHTLVTGTHRALEDLYLAGQATLPEVRTAHDEVFVSLARLDDPSALKDISQALTGLVTAAIEVIEIGGHEDYSAAIPPEVAERIRNDLQYLLTLDDDNLSRRDGLRSRAEDPTDTYHRAVVFMATRIEPTLQQLLIEKVGVWTESDFDVL
jgi:hypothetical protein